jgi:hypothetical protein
MTPAQEKDLAVRAKRAHERRYGQSTWIEAHCITCDGVAVVRVADHELGIVTYWTAIAGTLKGFAGRRIRFHKQIGEPRA